MLRDKNPKAPPTGHNIGKALFFDDVVDALKADPDHFAKAAITFAAGKQLF
jgi:hypothetical protein